MCAQVGSSHPGVILPLFFQGWLGACGDRRGVWGGYEQARPSSKVLSVHAMPAEPSVVRWYCTTCVLCFV